ncbi:MAG: type III-A CRISPR-associated protein Cas10/Csm1 [Desulfamplus sp.]|nr:type III-A CRISPR-associated protein Cas10/Csm1 [Desulfamplus sp.]
MDKNLKILLTGALLHDVGKFAQRAKRPYSKNLIGTYLPSYKSTYSHWHAVYTDYFIENDLPLPDELKDSRSVIARIASTHHKPDTANLFDMCIHVADCLSAGTDRFKKEGLSDEDKEHDKGSPNFRQARLISVFDEIELRKHTFKGQGNYFYELNALNTNDESMFPKKGKPSGDEKDYVKLFNQFLDALKQIDKTLEFRFYIESLISVLEKFTWAVPSSSYNTLSDVSLFDHSFSTAAIAQSLYIYHQQNGGIPALSDKKEEKFILAGGDISGIQNYIFGISKNSGRGVSKILRARSFFLQAITRSLILNIQGLDTLPQFGGLNSVCRLVDSGGKFILVLPNCKEVVKHLDNVDREMQIWFRTRFKGQLSAVLSSTVKASQQDFDMALFREKLDEVNESINAAKLNKLGRTFETMGCVIEGDYNDFENGNCSICQINAADDKASVEYKRYEQFDMSEDIRICRDCCDQITYIGAKLPGTSHLVYSRDGKIQLMGDLHLNLMTKTPDSFQDVIHIERLDDNSHDFAKARIARHLPIVSNSEIADEWLYKIFQDEDGFYELCKRENENERIKTFSMIAHKSKKKDELSSEIKMKGRSLIAFFKADVDNLGLIFSTGLGNDKFSVARFSSLSRMLNIFFSDYIVNLIKQEYPDIYVVYSGGDDLFLIGPWWQTARFSILLKNKLTQFCANNPDITISGGLFVAKPRMPMRKAAESAEEALENAKQFDNNNKNSNSRRFKDSVSFLDEVVSWQELEELLNKGDMFDKALKEKERTGFSMAFLYRLHQYQRMYRRFISGKNIKDGIYLSHAYYDIGRNIQNKNGKPRNNLEEMAMLQKIFAVGAKERDELNLLNIPLFYAMNLNRED